MEDPKPSPTKAQQREWDADRAMKALAEESTTFNLTPEQLADKLLEEALPVAVSSVVQLASYGETEKMRFDASRYIIDRGLGTPTQVGALQIKAGDPLERLLADCVEWNTTANQTNTTTDPALASPCEEQDMGGNGGGKSKS
jgi:hypothetical protein